MYRIIYSKMLEDLRGDLGLLKGLIKRLAGGLQVLKQMQIVHGDLKLENMLLMGGSTHSE